MVDRRGYESPETATAHAPSATLLSRVRSLSCRPSYSAVVKPSVIQFAFVSFGALVLEGLEASAEEDDNPAFMRCMGDDRNFTRDNCREWTPTNFSALYFDGDQLGDGTQRAAVASVLGEPPEFPWRNWDLCGAGTAAFVAATPTTKTLCISPP